MKFGENNNGTHFRTFPIFRSYLDNLRWSHYGSIDRLTELNHFDLYHDKINHDGDDVLADRIVAACASGRCHSSQAFHAFALCR